MSYANKNRIPYVILIGADEMASDTCTFKNMESGEQTNASFEQIVAQLNIK